jgi:hypothetical protein
MRCGLRRCPLCVLLQVLTIAALVFIVYIS